MDLPATAEAAALADVVGLAEVAAALAVAMKVIGQVQAVRSAEGAATVAAMKVTGQALAARSMEVEGTGVTLGMIQMQVLAPMAQSTGQVSVMEMDMA